ncbi:hypothetical protein METBISCDRAFT_17944 [Metschnikowia bicuspidata]|uniref:PH domain-containing protein n=1 Tax=Metschnikowia bicuspidata TaxID=27322 RepID=A0A4V1J2U1_9ASCO|nr:hypothetical protein METBISCDRAFT_17944 [Metschnikowia bicuspidata]
MGGAAFGLSVPRAKASFDANALPLSERLPNARLSQHHNGSIDVDFILRREQAQETQDPPQEALQQGQSAPQKGAPEDTVPGAFPGKAGSQAAGTAAEYHLKLISVAFKEAALDSPSFRASVNHLDSQLISTEKWLQAIVALLVKIPKHAKDLQSLFLYLEYLVPSFLQDGIVDQEYTLTALRSTRDGLQNLWTIAQSALLINLPSIDAWEKNTIGRMNKYKEVRARFRRSQQKYDHFLGIHMALPKGKDPALLLEDLMQLAAVRSEYLKASLDLVVELLDVSNYINRHLINFVYRIWQDKLEKMGENPFVLALFSDVWDEIKRIHCWLEMSRKSSVEMEQDMLHAKKNIQEHVTSLLAPSHWLEDYRSDQINQRLLQDTNETSTEKFGYLFMKTWTDRQKLPVWVRRWAFLQGGVFGFLVLDPSQTSVQETDKIGVLLCNIKYSPNEERHFCFEVKTIDTTIVLQAESLAELKSWLRVFSNVGTRIVDMNDPMHVLLKVSSGKYPPLVLEFQSTANTTMDRELTHSKIVSSSGEVIASIRLLAHLEKNEAFFQKYIYDRIGRICLPFVTETTRSALVAYSLTGSTVVPSALSANIWGSLNWGLYYLFEHNEGVDEPEPEDAQRDTAVPAPRNFPPAWVARDVQLKALFESAVESGEMCLLSYHCLLSPNQHQSLHGTHFVTQRHVYSYVQSLGFISLTKISLGRILEASVTPMQDHDMLRYSMLLGLLKLRLFLDDSQLVLKKLQFLLRNHASDRPLGVSTVIQQLLRIEETHQQQRRAERLHIFTALPLVRADKGSETALIDPADTMPLVGEKLVDLPPQALLHFLFGSKSYAFMDLYQVMDVRLCETMAWLWCSDGRPRRQFQMDVMLFNGRSERVGLTQELERSVENRFYSVMCRNTPFKMKYGPHFDLSMRFVIQQSCEGQSLLKYYGLINVNASFLARLAPKYLGNTIIPNFFTEISRKIADAVKEVGPKGKLAKANYLYGRLAITDRPVREHIAGPVVIDTCVIFSWCVRLKMLQVTRSLQHAVLYAAAAVAALADKLSTHGFLLGVIFCLVVSNVFLSARISAQYWQTRQAARLVRDIVNTGPAMVPRAVYSREAVDFALNISFVGDSACARAFRKQSVLLNQQRLAVGGGALETGVDADQAREFRRRARDIALKRYELFLSLATLNQMELEVVQTEWRHWLASESVRCDEMRHGIFGGNASLAVWERLGHYCDSCAQELAHL